MLSIKEKKDGLLDSSVCTESIFTLDKINFSGKKATEGNMAKGSIFTAINNN